MQEIAYAVQFVLAYFLLLVWLPAKVMGWKLLDEENGFEYAVKSLAISHLVLINGVFLLAFLGIYRTPFLVLYLCIVLAAAVKLRGLKYRALAERILIWSYHIVKKEYKLSVYLRRWGGALSRHILGVVRSLFKCFFNRDIFQNLLFVGSMAVIAYRRFEAVWGNYAYLTSDMYVHHSWINYMEDGQMFYDGIYPFGMHNMISAFHKLTGLNLNTVMRFWGPFTAVLMVAVLYWFSKKIFHSGCIAVLPVVIYCVSDFINNAYSFRLAYTLPQETGMIFLLPCAFFLGRYLMENRKSDGLWFALTAGLMVSFHFYTAIFGILLCLGICLGFLKKLLNWKRIRSLFLWVLVAALVSITPFGIGMLQGYYWQGSTSWALNVISSSTDSSSEESLETEETDGAKKDNPGILERIRERAVSCLARIREGVRAAVDAQIENMPEPWGKCFLASLTLLGLIGFIRVLLLRRNGIRDRMKLSVWCCSAFTVCLYVSWAFGLPMLMQEVRLRIFLGYIAPLVVAAPIDYLGTVPVAWLKCFLEYGLTGVLSGAICLSAWENGFPYQSCYDLETSLAAEACLEIQKEYEDSTWTMVSPVEEFTLNYNRGYHYELWEFITDMEEYEEGMTLTIPTEYVFFVLEKRPIQYNQVQNSDEIYLNEELSEEDADRVMTKEALQISDGGEMLYYSVYENRRGLEAKLYCWLEAYMEIFAEQFEIYMEDEECVIYKFTQNPEAPNNLAIDYGYNETAAGN
ncbi:MAG: hypothetical protein LUI07_07200 [Lachnospiraceae bacterium]|nr:hypothetical protein [Lachnospiraceae bacterium]